MKHRALQNLSKDRQRLLDILVERFEEYGEDFFVGILVLAKHPEDTKKMLKFLEKERSHDDVVCEALWINNERYHPDRNIPLDDLGNNV